MNELLREMPKDGWFIAGGHALGLLTTKQHKGDIDIFFISEEALGEAKSIYTHTIIYDSDYATTYDNNVQFVHYKFGTPKEILETFDLNVCRVAYIPYREEFIDLRGDTPNEIKIMEPENYTLFTRVEKYLFRDFTIDAEQLKYLRTLMTTDGLKDKDAYGVGVYMKFTEEEFASRLFTIGNNIDAEVYFEVLWDFDFLFGVVQEKAKHRDSLVDFSFNFLRLYDLDKAKNSNQRYAILMNNNKLTGEVLQEAKDEFPEHFV